MKLRNKKTGEIGELSLEGNSILVTHSNGEMNSYFITLAELCADWEDYEEDELLYIVSAEHRSGYQCVLKEDYPEICKVAKELGIGFETEKECRKAVEKLKTWQRLKNKGAEFYGWRRNQTGTYELFLRWEDRTPRSYEVKKDLDTCFGGEE